MRLKPKNATRTEKAASETVVLWLRLKEFRLVDEAETVPIVVKTTAKLEHGKWHAAKGESFTWQVRVNLARHVTGSTTVKRLQQQVFEARFASPPCPLTWLGAGRTKGSR